MELTLFRLCLSSPKRAVDLKQIVQIFSSSPSGLICATTFARVFCRIGAKVAGLLAHFDLRHPVKRKPNEGRVLTLGLILSVVCLSWVSPGYPEEPGTQEIAKQWEEIASLRYQAAIGHELRSEQKEALGTETPGEALSGAGDEKVSASGGYKTASEHWKKAAEAYELTGDLDHEKKARYNSDLAWEAAKRTLREAAEFHMRAAKQYEDTNNLSGKVKALEKVASDLEGLMKMD